MLSGYRIIENKWMTRKLLIPSEIVSRTRKPRGIKRYHAYQVPDDQNCYIDHINKVIYAHPLFIKRLAGQDNSGSASEKG